jgi:hypothetical protein
MTVAMAEYELTAQALDASYNPDRRNPDDRLRVQFSTFPEIDQAATAKEGRPIFKEAIYINVMVPGERDIVHRRAWEKDFERFPRQYSAFMNKQNQDLVSGTPLKIVPWLTLGQVKELEFFNCYTLEQLANMPDSQASKFMQIQKLKQLAKDHLQAAKEAAPLTAMRAEMDEKDNRISTMEKQIQDLIRAVKAGKEEEDE